MRRKLFKFISRLVARWPKQVIGIAILLTIASVICAATGIRLNSNLDELVSMKLDYHRRYIDFLKEFGDEEYLYVVVDASRDIAKSKEYFDVLGQNLKGNPNLKQVIWKIDNPALEKNFLLYLTDDQLKSLKLMLGEGPFSVVNIASWRGFSDLFGAMAERITKPVSAEDETELSTGFTFIDGLLDDMARSMQEGAPYSSRLQSLFFGGGETFDPDGYIKNGALLFMLIMPQKDYSTAAVIERPLKDIRQAIADLKGRFPDVDAGLTGRPVLSADEMETSNRDMTFATILAIILVAGVFMLCFRGIARPLCAVAALVMGISWTSGFIALVIGELNILSIVFALLLIGASIEYSIYITARYEEELSKSGDPRDAVARALQTTGMANITSALTTAAAFCTLLWTDFIALAQLGVISAAGIVFCLAAMLVVLPAMLIIVDDRKTAARLKMVRSFSLPALVKLYRRPNILFASSMVVVLALSFFARRISFDNNLLNLQAEGLDSVKYEHLIIEKSSETTWFARAVAETVEESHKLAEKLRVLPTVRRVDDVEKIVPEDQDAKIEIVKGIAPSFEGLKFSKPDDAVNDRVLMYELGRFASNLERLEAQAFSSGRVDAVDELSKFSDKMRRLVAMIQNADAGMLSRLAAYQRDFFGDLEKNISLLATGMNPTKIAIGDLPEDIRGRFVSSTGRYALFIYPKDDIWDPDALARFVADIRSVDPDVIGTPIEVHESGMLMRDTFAKSALLAFAIICLLVWLDFRNVRASIIAIIPLACGLALLFGTMGLVGIQFNMANFFAIPILIGTGVDFGVQVTHRLRQEKSFAALGTSTGRGLVMTALANGIGFGSMMIAHHRGVASLGKILAMGCVFCLFAAVFVTPPVARWLGWGIDMGGGKKRPDRQGESGKLPQ